MKKIFFILCATMFCYGCVDNSQQNRESENNEEAILIATMKSDMESFITERVAIKDYSGIQEFELKQIIYDYSVYDQMVSSTQWMSSSTLTSDFTPNENFECEEGCMCIELTEYLDEDCWLTYLLFNMYYDAMQNRIYEKDFVNVYVYKCKIDCSLPYDDVKSTLVIDVILDEHFKVNMLRGFRIYQDDRIVYGGW